MKTKIFAAAILALSLFAGGCATARPIVDSEQQIPVDIRATSPITVSSAQAASQDGRVLVSGTLERSIRVRMPGHVDVLFLQADGSPIAEKQVQVAGLRSKRHGMQAIQFRADIDLELPPGSTAVFTYHPPSS